MKKSNAFQKFNHYKLLSTEHITGGTERVSDRFLEKGDYIRLRNITVGH